ncbi:hypothetical protein RCO48_34685 [Peribacillus frigoritolerans]|nr:hypothetical protein [Peribacillus frigoritolerans]
MLKKSIRAGFDLSAKREIGMVSSRTMILKKQDQIILNGFFPVTLIGLKKFATLLPKKLASRDPHRRLGQGGLADSRRKGSGFLKSTGTFLNKKTAVELAFLRICLCLKPAYGLVFFM